jgi:hypothetical protein
VLATHGRGIWILDDISSLQQLTPQVLAGPAHLFAPRPAEQIRYFNPKAHQGDMVFRGDNPPAGAIIDYYMRDSSAMNAPLAIVDAAGQQVARLQAPHLAGVNRVIWNLRHDPMPPGPADEESGGRPSLIPGPFVIPGEYTVRLTAGDRIYEQKLQVLEDPRIQIAAADRTLWTDALLAIGAAYRGAAALVDEVARRSAAASDDLPVVARELQSRLLRLYRDVAQSTAKPTADQQAQLQFLKTELESLRRRVNP